MIEYDGESMIIYSRSSGEYRPATAPEMERAKELLAEFEPYDGDEPCCICSGNVECHDRHPDDPGPICPGCLNDFVEEECQ